MDTKMINLKIDGVAVSVPDGTTILEAARQAGVNVPTLCYMKDLNQIGACRICVVEANEGRGFRTVASCVYPVTEGMEVKTNSLNVQKSRKMTLELLLSTHDRKCLSCVRSDNCEFQALCRDYGVDKEDKFDGDKPHYELDTSAVHMIRDNNKCVLCRRCVRFMKEIVGEEILGVVGRGGHNAIACFPGKTLDSNYSMNVVDICPVGAMTSKDFRFKMRVWFLKSTPTIDTNCGTGTNIFIWSREQQIYRITPRQNDAVNSCWMPDNHRLNYKYVNSEKRILTPLVKTDVGAPQRPGAWEPTLSAVSEQLRRCNPKQTAIIVSARLTNEELYLAGNLAQLLGISQLDIVPRSGEPDGMLICADRNPNTTGAKLILDKDGRTLDDIRLGIKNGKIRHLIVIGEDVTAEAAIPESHLSKLDYLLVIDHSETATTRAADVVLPGVTFAEKYGTMVNITGRLQRLNKAIEPLGASRADWDILRSLLQGSGGDMSLLTARAQSPMEILDEIAAQFPAFKGVSWAAVGNSGIPITETGETIPLIEREQTKQ